MGWTGTMLDHNRRVTAEEAIEAELGRDILPRVIAHAKKGGVVYAAVRDRTDPAQVWGLVLLVTTGKSHWGEGRELTTKAMDETMGPGEDECPARILDLLTPTDSECANQWRERCRENLRKRAEARKNATAVKAGTRIKLAQPLDFHNGHRGDTFEYVKGSTFRAIIEVDGEPYAMGLYNLPRWRERAYEVVA